MWVHRGVLYIKPGLMAEAIAHAKTVSVPEGEHGRMLRPINGPEAMTQLIVESEFEDIDAAFASHGRPGPVDDDWWRRWLELNQNRGCYELYQVLHTVSGDGPPGLWVDRRVRFCPRARLGEALDLWRALPPSPIPGYSLRVLLPRTSSERTQPLVVECTAASLTEWELELAKDSPGAAEWVRKLHACEEEGYPIVDLLRVVE